LTLTRLALIAVVIISAFLPVRADIIFPARLELKETEPAVFTVNFNLPIISGRRLKARPVLPDVCRDLTEHDIKVTQSSYREIWKISCQPEDLFGEQIVIEGLLGTRVDVMLFMETLDGRQYSVILKPSRTSYTIPLPPSILELGVDATFEGMRRFLKRPDLLLMLLVIAFSRTKKRVLWVGFAGYLLGHGLGQFLAQHNWLILSAYLPPLLTPVFVLLPALDLASARPTRPIWSEYLWIPTLLFGLLSGGAFPETLALEGLSKTEQQYASIFLNSGITLGILLAYLLMSEFNRVLLLIKGINKSGVSGSWIGYVAATICFGLLLYQASALLFVPLVFPKIPSRYYVYAIILGFWFWRIGWENRSWISIVFVVVLEMGMIPGLLGINLPFDSVVVLSSIVLFAVTLIFQRQLSLKIGLIIAIFTAVLQGWSFGFFVKENMTLPIANAMGAALVISFLFLTSLSFINGKFQKTVPGRLRIVAGIAAGLAVVWRIGEYRAWFNSAIVTDWAMGLVTLPVLSLVLILFAILAWPKKRIILEKLELNTRKPVLHWIYISLAFFLISVGSIQVKNPFFKPRALAEGEAKRVLQQVLSNTFHAFNLADENQLYDQLSQNISGDLITDIYLDSRRRLNAGVRTGGEVTVREVSVLSARQIGESSNPSDGFSYESKWAVTARVRHLQHVHHRQNIYSGVIKIKIDERSWKIAAIELLSEDRVIIPGSAG